MRAPVLTRGLTFGAKLSRLRHRMADPQWRKYGATLVAGKLLGVGLVLLLMLAVEVGPALLAPRPAHAQSAQPAASPATGSPTAGANAAAAPATPPPALDYPAATASDVINPLNTLWVMVAAFLVFGMQAGFTMLEAGMCRSRETVNVLVECAFDTCLCGILFWAWGFAFMFGHGNGWVGWGNGSPEPHNNWFFLHHVPATYETTGVALLAYWVFQFAFADCASTICSGAMIGRTGFWGDVLYSVAVSGFIYPIVGHWAWGPDGWLAVMGSAGNHFAWLGTGFHDFAGSTVVHTIGGTIALAGAIVLGPRLGRTFKRDGGGPMLPHDLTIAVVGGLILWFGWYGFNPGSTLSAMDMAGCGRVAANTTLAACAAGLTAEFLVYSRTWMWDAGAITNGFLGGLVAITCTCYWVSPLGAVLLGGVAGVVAILAGDLLEFLRIDDPIGAVPVHMACGIWGTWSLGLLACGQYSSATATGMDPKADKLVGLLYKNADGHHDWHLLAAQVIGNGSITLATFAAAMVVFLALNALGVLRISKHGEIEGMDLHEHGTSAYPEYVLTASAAPAGMPPEMVLGKAPARS